MEYIPAFVCHTCHHSAPTTLCQLSLISLGCVLRYVVHAFQTGLVPLSYLGLKNKFGSMIFPTLEMHMLNVKKMRGEPFLPYV